MFRRYCEHVLGVLLCIALFILLLGPPGLLILFAPQPLGLVLAIIWVILGMAAVSLMVENA